MTSPARLSLTAHSLSASDARLLIENIADYAIVMLTPDGHVASWNVGAERSKGYGADEIVGEHFSRFYTPEDLEAGKPERELATAREVGRVEEEGWRVRKDGSCFWASVVITAMRDETGTLRGFAKVTRDITEKRLADERVREAEGRFHHLVDAVTDYAVFLLDATGHVSTWNSGAERTKGYREEEIVGRHFSVFYTPEDRAAGVPERILETVRRRGRAEQEGWRLGKDGTRFWANVVITPLNDENGDLIGFAKVTRDLTDRRAREEDLLRSEERFRLLVESVGDYAIYMLDPEGRVTTWNLGAERMKGYSAGEILGKHFAAFFPEQDARAGKPALELDIARTEGRFEAEGWRVRKDGTRFCASIVVSAIRDPQGTLLGFAKVTRDLTRTREAAEMERKLMLEQAARVAAEHSERRIRASEDAARHEARRAEDANRLKDDFLATVSHELRTPLHAILGWAAVLQARDMDASFARAVQAIQRNAQAQSKLIEDILDVSRIISGKLGLDLKPTDLVAITGEAIDVVRPSAQAKGISVELTPPRRLPALVADPERLRQVIWNLLSNAVKFTENGGRIVVSFAQDGSNLTVSVSDTGRGIEQEFLPYVFERFKQADSSTTRRYGGLGLGLAIVRHIVELHGGHVRAESEGKGRGSCFSVTIPVRAVVAHAQEEHARVARAALPADSHAHRLRGLKVLVTDDDPDARELLEVVLGGAGAIVETAETAAAAFDTVLWFRPDVVVSDIGMPDEDGYSFVRRLRALHPRLATIPSIALTAYARAEDRAMALEAGFTKHVAKPVQPDDLVAAVASLAPSPR